MNIFVAKLSPHTDGFSLRQLFEQYGEVSSSKVIMDRESGRSKCYGFVEMDSDTEGQAAIDALNGTEHEGNTIVVKVSAPRGGGGDRRGGGGYRPRRDNNDRGGYNRRY